jgi:hypothetical protein
MRSALIPLMFVTMAALVAGQDGAAGCKYPLTEREGPWLVHVASFRGDEALNFANNLADEVRSKHKLNAFVFSMEDQSARQEADALRKAQLERIGSDKVHGTDEALKLRKVRVVKEYSVFVGNFREQLEARTLLDKIKAFEPPTSIPAYGFEMYDNAKVQMDPTSENSLGVFGLKARTREVEAKKRAASQGNPFRQAFVCRNPIHVQQQSTVVQKPVNTVDPLWQALNAKEKYSIFTCPKPWTLVVAQFRPPTEVYGASTNVFQQNGIQQVSGQTYGRHLEVCAEQARKLAEVLRDGGKGYDAYVFHLANQSIVCVGAFDKRTDENMEKAFYALAEFAATQKSGPFSCLMKVPQPMPVPGK